MELPTSLPTIRDFAEVKSLKFCVEAAPFEKKMKNWSIINDQGALTDNQGINWLGYNYPKKTNLKIPK